MNKKEQKRQNKISNNLIKNIIYIIAIPILGFLMLGITFFIDFIYQTIIRGIVDLFIPLDMNTNFSILPPLFHLSFLLIVLLISFFIIRSKLWEIAKAIYLVVLVATVLVTIGMFFYNLPIIVYLLGGIFVLSVLYYLYYTRLNWIYYYSTLLISITLAIFTLIGGEI